MILRIPFRRIINVNFKGNVHKTMVRLSMMHVLCGLVVTIRRIWPSLLFCTDTEITKLDTVRV